MVQVKHLKLKDKIMGLYNKVTGSTANQTQRSTGSERPSSGEPEPFKPIELEQASMRLTEAMGLMEDPR